MNVKKIEIINSELQRQIAMIIDHEVKDPRVKCGMISVTSVNTTPDLKYAKVYVSVFAGESEESKVVADGAFAAVQNAAGFIRNAMKDRVKIRLLPELTFVRDDSVNYGIKIDRIIAGLNIKNEDGSANDEN